MNSTVDKAIIIAAGRGSRLMPYTDEMPKCLVPVGDGDDESGTPTIASVQMNALRAGGITDVVFIRGYKGDVLETRRAELGGIRFVDNREWEHNNILESLFCARGELDGAVVLSYSDIIYTDDVVRALLADDGDISLVIDRDFRSIYAGRDQHPLSEAEVCTLAGDRVSLVGKRALPAESAYGEFIGLVKLSAAGATLFCDTWQQLCERYEGRRDQPFERAPSFRKAYLTDLLQHLIGLGHRVSPVTIEGQWREIDTVQDLARARNLLSSGHNRWR